MATYIGEYKRNKLAFWFDPKNAFLPMQLGGTYSTVEVKKVKNHLLNILCSLPLSPVLQSSKMHTS